MQTGTTTSYPRVVFTSLTGSFAAKSISLHLHIIGIISETVDYSLAGLPPPPQHCFCNMRLAVVPRHRSVTMRVSSTINSNNSSNVTALPP